MALTDEQAKALQESVAAATKAAEVAQAHTRRMQESLILRDARDVAVRYMGRVKGLHALTADRLVGEMVAKAPVVEAEDGTKSLDVAKYEELCKESVAAELKYLQETAGIGTGRVEGMGATEPEAELTMESAQAALKGAASRLGLSEKEAAIFASGRSG